MILGLKLCKPHFSLPSGSLSNWGHKRQKEKLEAGKGTCSFCFCFLFMSVSWQQQFVSHAPRTVSFASSEILAPACSCPFSGPSLDFWVPTLQVSLPKLLGYQHQLVSSNNLILSLCSSRSNGRSCFLEFLYLLLQCFLSPFSRPITL